MRKIISTAVMALFVLGTPARGQTVYVSPSGNDGNPCLSPSQACATLQRAADIITNVGTVLVECGTYTGVNVQYYKMVNIVGDTSNPRCVIVRGITAFTAQDKAIVTVAHIKCAATSTCIYARQDAIVDFWDIACGAMSVCIAVQEKAKANCMTPFELDGDVTYPFAAGSQSQLILSCDIRIPAVIDVYAFSWAAWGSLINANGISIDHPQNVDGMSYVNDSSILINAAAFPGHGHLMQHGGIVE